MIAKVNDPAVAGALCNNCKSELRSMVVETNKGKQALYVCENENCTASRRFMVTVEYLPPAETGAVAPAKK